MKKSFEQHMEEIRKMHKETRKLFDSRPITGERILIPRDGMEGVDGIIYKPKQPARDMMPVLFNMHGGAFVGGDAVLMDSFCRKVADCLSILVVNINYKKAPEHPFPYAVTEVADTIEFCAAHADEYKITPERMAVGGFSAGASLAAGAALKIKATGRTPLACQLLVYPVTDLYSTLNTEKSDDESLAYKYMVKAYCQNDDADHIWASPLLGSQGELSGVCPAIFITCGLDSLREQGEAYAKQLIDCGVPVSVMRYQNALHGFIEVNRPDYFMEDDRKTPEQADLTEKAENYILQALKMYLS